jgi:hypothetical protein
MGVLTINTYARYPCRLTRSIVVSRCHYEAEKSKDEYRRDFKAANEDGSPGPGIVNEQPFWVFYYTVLAIEPNRYN